MRETKKLEFKEAMTDTFLKTVSAFANYGTGQILFGIDDNGKTVGINNIKETKLNIENKINDSIHPYPNFDFKINKANKVIALTVYQGEHTPYLFKGKAYKRNDTSTIAVDRFELDELTLNGTNQTFDLLPAKEQKLSFDTLTKALKNWAFKRLIKMF